MDTCIFCILDTSPLTQLITCKHICLCKADSDGQLIAKLCTVFMQAFHGLHLALLAVPRYLDPQEEVWVEQKDAVSKS